MELFQIIKDIIQILSLILAAIILICIIALLMISVIKATKKTIHQTLKAGIWWIEKNTNFFAKELSNLTRKTT